MYTEGVISNEDEIPVFDEAVFYLSKRLCKRKHEFGATGRTLRRRSNGLCPECHRELNRRYRATDAGKESVRRASVRSRENGAWKRWADKNREWVREYGRQQAAKNRDARNAASKRFAQRHPDRIKAYRAKVRKTLKFALRRLFWVRMNKYTVNGKQGPSKKYGIDFPAIISKLGECPGERSEYSVDHVIPLKYFRMDDPEEVKLAWAPENHQWMLRIDNSKKRCSIPRVCPPGLERQYHLALSRGGKIQES